MSRTVIMASIAAERERQDQIWGGAAHDDRHQPSDWIRIACHLLGLAAWDGAPDDACHPTESTCRYDPARYRRKMMQAAATLVAALEAFDRRAALSNGHAPEDHPLAAPGPGGDVRAMAAAGELWDATPSHGGGATEAGYLSREGEAPGLRPERRD